MYLSIGVTGHRDLLEQEMPELESRVRAFFIGLAQRFPRLKLQLLCPLAEGGDQLAARIAVEQGIDLIAVLPMEREAYEQDFDSAASLANFHALLMMAKQVICLPEAPLPKRAGTSDGMAERERQYAQVGLFISNHCQMLLALWDGKPAEAVGGTAHIVNYHLTSVMEGFEDQQSSANLLADNENGVVFHVVCSRKRLEGKPQQGLAPLECYWISSRTGRVPAGEMPGDYALMLGRLQQFEADRSRHATGQHLSETLLAGLPAGPEVPDSARFTEGLFLVADSLANHFQKRVNRNLIAMHGLALLMGLVFILYSEYNLAKYVLWIFLALFFIGLGLHFTNRRREWHRKYLDYRALAEALRVQFYWNLAGVVETRSVAFAYENFLQKQDVELGWIRHVMRAASTQRARGIEPDPGWVPWVIDNWVGDADGKHGQLAYYEGKAIHNAVSYRRTEFLGAACLWAGIAVTVILATATEYIDSTQQHFLLVLMGILPLTAGIRDSISHKRAEKELIKQYRFMARIFTNARRMLGTAGNVSFQRRVLKALGEAALEEGAEWILMHRSRPLEHKGFG